MDENALVARIAAVLAAVNGAAPDLSDDCALLPTDRPTRLVSADTLIEGVHFDLRRDSFEQVGAQAAVANLSDIAASGGRPEWLVWSLVLPKGFSPDAVAALTLGFARTAAAHGARLVGGNLSVADGPLTVAVTVGGSLWGETAITRTGARPGDLLYLAGVVGDAALGYLECDTQARTYRHQWRPQVTESQALCAWGQVRAMLDVSDGVLRDVDRLGKASGVGIRLHSAGIPVSAHYRTRRGSDLRVALSGGEDYVLLFAAPPGAPPPIVAACIGTCTTEPGLWLDDRPVAPLGYDHLVGAEG
jgi:thiamine-monophosphate kinase